MKNNLAIMAVTLLASVNAYANVYKWVDKNGEVHYTQTPPSEGTATKLPPPPKPSSSAKSEQKKITEMEKQFQTTQEQQKKDAIDLQKQAIEERTRAINCDRAKSRLKTLEIKARIRLETAQGKSGPMTPEEKDLELQQTKNDVEKYCSPKPEVKEVNQEAKPEEGPKPVTQ